REDVGLDGRLEPVDPAARLAALDRVVERLLVEDRAHALVGVHPTLELGVERLERRLADPGHHRAGLAQRSDELALVLGEGRLDEDHVHGAGLTSCAGPWVRPRPAALGTGSAASAAGRP